MVGEVVTETVPQGVAPALAVAENEGMIEGEALVVAEKVGDSVADAEGEGVAELGALSVYTTEGDGDWLLLPVTVTERDSRNDAVWVEVAQKEPQGDTDTRADAEDDPEAVARGVIEGEPVAVFV
jgi:hypothetical protein